MSVDLGALYAAARGRITAVLEHAPRDVGVRPCPATPGWSVADVVAHLRGITEDVRTGNLAGVTTDPWTAAQVDRHRGESIGTMLHDWAVDAAPFEQFLSGPHGGGAMRAVIDVHTHEYDIYGAIGIRPPLPDAFAVWALGQLVDGFVERATAAGLSPLVVQTPEGDALGVPAAPVSLRASRLELFRAALGRRCPAQVAAFEWDGAEPAPYLQHFFVFSPRQDPLEE